MREFSDEMNDLISCSDDSFLLSFDDDDDGDDKRLDDGLNISRMELNGLSLVICNVLLLLFGKYLPFM